MSYDGAPTQPESVPVDGYLPGPLLPSRYPWADPGQRLCGPKVSSRPTSPPQVSSGGSLIPSRLMTHRSHPSPGLGNPPRLCLLTESQASGRTASGSPVLRARGPRNTLLRGSAPQGWGQAGSDSHGPKGCQSTNPRSSSRVSLMSPRPSKAHTHLPAHCQDPSYMLPTARVIPASSSQAGLSEAAPRDLFSAWSTPHTSFSPVSLEAMANPPKREHRLAGEPLKL